MKRVTVSFPSYSARNRSGPLWAALLLLVAATPSCGAKVDTQPDPDADGASVPDDPDRTRAGASSGDTPEEDANAMAGIEDGMHLGSWTGAGLDGRCVATSRRRNQ